MGQRCELCANIITNINCQYQVFAKENLCATVNT